jgi:hypothetical protein
MRVAFIILNVFLTLSICWAGEDTITIVHEITEVTQFDCREFRNDRPRAVTPGSGYTGLSLSIDDEAILFVRPVRVFYDTDMTAAMRHSMGEAQTAWRDGGTPGSFVSRGGVIGDTTTDYTHRGGLFSSTQTLLGCRDSCRFSASDGLGCVITSVQLVRARDGHYVYIHGAIDFTSPLANVFRAIHPESAFTVIGASVVITADGTSIVLA